MIHLRPATGLIRWFLKRYGYHLNPYEIEARAAETQDT